ncbi:putative virulence factor [Rhodobacter capsulatus]|uniref:putative virulence factor n=1 Tax=Rhodobacter capsulatus TaxID=1061 RepID=UPI0040278E50
MSSDSISERCITLAGLGRAALGWLDVQSNADRVGAEKGSMTRTLRRAVRRAERLGKSARTPMSVSVFGPSQAGKSFLVSVLARPADGRLVAQFGPTGLDYISELNPEGEGESTGLVTRFTCTRPEVPAGFPIRLSLLSEADLARVIANSFFMDGDKSEPPPEPADLTAHLDTFQTRRQPQPLPGMSDEDVIEIAEYIETNFARQSSYAAALKSFRDPAAALAPLLAPEDRAEFLSVFWGRHAPMTQLYRELAGSLAQIGHPEEIHVGLEAVVPRESSILDVKTLADVLSPATGAQTIEVLTGAGLRAKLPRARICALAAELVLPMRDVPHPLFATTDLLDFPGARNRFNKALEVTLKDPETLPGLLLRGKVAYLFDRYVENQEITSMLLCVPDSNMETVDLPRLVSTWIERTHGARPDQRALVDCILFFVLTKFDKHLGDNAAAGGEASRFQRRMEASLLEKFSNGSDNWVDSWAAGRPFQNCFWLRNPNFYVDGLIDYDDDRRELRIRPEKAARIAELRQGCLEAAAVRRHFADPEGAWDAALTLNDGGVRYLVEALTRVCKPDQKLRQIEQQLGRVVDDLLQTLAPHHVADDLHTRIEEKRKSCNAILDDLLMALQQHRFGAVLSALGVNQDAIAESIVRVPSSIRIGSAVSAAASTGSAGAGPVRPAAPARPGGGTVARPGGGPAPATPEAAARGGEQVRTLTLEEFQAEQSILLWIEGIKAFRDDPARASGYGLRPQSIADLVAELIHAARRTGLSGRMAERLSELNFGLTVERLAPTAAVLTAEMINDFVATLGMSALPETARPTVTPEVGPPRPAFARRPGQDDVTGLPATPRATASDMWEDWAFALDAVMDANARDGLGGDIDIEQNLRLGAILEGMHREGRR